MTSIPSHEPPRARLRALLRRPAMLVAPGAFDAIGARIVEEAGFEAVYMTGAGVSLARGYPDLGLLGVVEMADAVRVLARSTRLPVIADADTGYGNELNVTRTVQDYEAAGAAGLHLEDQVAPKRCGHLAGKEVVSRSEFLAKIRAAVAARRDPDFLLIARTDARATDGFDEAVWRANAALDAGADMAFVEATQSAQEAAEVPRAVHGPCLLNVVQGGRTPVADLRQAEEMGYRMTILPSVLMTAFLEAGDAALAALHGTRQVAASRSSVQDVFRRFGMDAWNALRQPLAGENGQ
ncbi:isocitrate lyase/PEP mutase family protein [Ramlibacter rhizophilus]|uniref:Isocitrate lyase/PEP mutase family protein n=1 Tax=Ramlibacter rhizophilus TaxID=1781167 RepID=A0A4Z0C2L9_9BURK|nr:isocitrate lyase/PEP mutase family protein [Ramlibacter rhizophilus]TFZ04449.1 isocitrate lyase/PEP mutase family protein [Ramlibacter rhizophilus]